VGDPHIRGEIKMSVERYGVAGNAAEPSENIWKDFPSGAVLAQPGRYVHIWEDFIGNFTANDVQNVGGGNQWLVTGTNPDTAVVADEAAGVINLSGSGGANDEVIIGCNILQDELIKLNSGRRCWFETRLKMDDVSADVSTIFGLGATELLAAEFITDDSSGSSTINDYDFIGFHTKCDGTNQEDLDTVYHQTGDGGAPTVVQASVRTFGATTTYDDVYMKLGLRFDGKKKVTFYLDGVALGTTLNIDDLTGNKLDAPLTILLGLKALAGSADDLKIDWIRYGAEKFASGI
jgi:hypothetical protein